MTIWVDAQLSPAVAGFLTEELGVPSSSLRELGLRDANDELIFFEARKANAIVMTKEEDFSLLLARHGAPPKIIWITCGNTSNNYLFSILNKSLKQALNLMDNGVEIVELL